MGGALTFRRARTALTAIAALAACSSLAAAQNAVVTGRVTSTAGQPLGGANVALKVILCPGASVTGKLIPLTE